MQHIGFKILNADESAVNFFEEWNSDKPLINAHTSGSTGAPKQISLSKNDVIASAHATNQFFTIRENDYLSCPLSCDYIAGKMMLVRALKANAIVDFNKNIFCNASLNSIPEIKLMAIVPAQISQLLENQALLNKIKTLLIGGAPLTLQMEQHLIDHNINAYLSYGMTETCSHVAIRKIGENRFTALPGIKFSLSNRNTLCISGYGRTWSPIETNDEVELISETQFHWLGRADFAINSGGIKVHPEILENKLRPFIPPSVNFYITKENHPRWGERVVLIMDTTIELSEEALSSLNKAERPKKIIIRKIEFTSSGKIIRRKP